MDAKKYLGGKYLKGAELGKAAVRVVIQRVTEERMTKDDDAEGDEKMVLYFVGKDKGVVLSAKTNIEMVAYICGTYDTQQWTGHEVEMFFDPTVSFGGKRVGGIRFRAPTARNTSPDTRPTAPPPVHEFDVDTLPQIAPPRPPAPPVLTDDDIPF